MTGDYEFASGDWWRFSEYEIVGAYIRPAQDAALERYDPWDVYYSSRANGLRDPAPFEELLSLVETLRIHPGGTRTRYALDPDGEARVLAWCREHGLLGILPHQALAITLQARWAKRFGSDSADVLYPTVTQLLRTSGGWKERKYQVLMGDNVYEASGDPELENQPVEHPHYPADFTRPGIILQDLRGMAIREENLEYLWQFFPAVPVLFRKTFLYPVPNSEKFWRLYSEPLDSFIDAALLLRDAVDGMRNLPRLKEATDEEARAVFDGRALLHALAAPASPFLSLFMEGRAEMHWVCLSLLSAYAMMAMEDVTRGARIHRCTVCRKLFTSNAPKATYCTVRCRQTAQKRAYRQRHPRPKGQGDGTES